MVEEKKKAVSHVNSPQVHSGMKQQESIIYDRNYGKSELYPNLPKLSNTRICLEAKNRKDYQSEQ